VLADYLKEIMRANEKNKGDNQNSVFGREEKDKILNRKFKSCPFQLFG